MNLVLISIDALRPDHLGTYGYDRKTDQAIDPFRDRLAVFQNAYTYSFPTVRAYPAIMASIWPELCESKVSWQYCKKLNLPKRARTLARVYHDAGYFCAAHTGWGNFLTSRQGYANGVDEFVGMLRQDLRDRPGHSDRWFAKLRRYLIYLIRYMPSERFVHGIERLFHWARESVNARLGTNIQEPGGFSGRSGEPVTNYLIEAIKRNKDRPFFVWGNYHDVHIPLNPAEQFAYALNVTPFDKRALNEAIFRKAPLSPGQRTQLIDLYDGAIRQVFHYVRRLFDVLSTEQLLDKTIVVVTSDHGFGFWEHRYWEYPEGQFYNESIRVPLLLYDPRLCAHQLRIEGSVSLIDLAPTLIELCGLSPEKQFFGCSFASLLRNPKTRPERPVWLETLGPPNRLCLIKNGIKLIYDRIDDRLIQCLSIADQEMQITENSRQRFLEELRAYDEKKSQFLNMSID